MADQRLGDLIARAREADGSPPFSDGALVELAAGDRELIWWGDAAALATASEAEFVVDPAARLTGLGGRLLALLLDRGARTFWAHGDHPGARALARAHGLVPARTLLHLQAPVPPATAPALAATAFTPTDTDAWLDLNTRAFADHPEQGGVTEADLATLMAEPWFDADDFLLLREGGELIGYVWLKVEASEGEFYVVGVSPARQDEGWGRRLVELGFARLASRGIPTAHLYVEGDNVPALKLYRSVGFTQRSIDIQYRRDVS